MLRSLIRRLSFAACFSLILSAPGAAHAPELHGFRMVSFEPPAPAPGFDLLDLEDRQLSLEDFRGRFVLLNFWGHLVPALHRGTAVPAEPRRGAEE